MKKAEINLVTNSNDPNKFDGRISGDIDILAKMIVASLTIIQNYSKKRLRNF